jgi:hypothetical protein
VRQSRPWRGFNSLFNSAISYQVLKPVEGVEVTMAQTMVEKPIGSPSEDTQQSTQFGSPNEVQKNTDVKLEATLCSIPKIIMNVFGTLHWLTKK